MTLIKRLATSMVLFVFLFVVLYFGICIIGGFLHGSMAGLNHPNSPDGVGPGAQAGADFVNHNIRAIVLSAFGISLVSALVLSFSGILSWCRKPLQQ
jgi:hypothetical protein